MGFGESTSPRVEEVAKAIVDAAFKVHSRFGPGLLESVYESCLAAELARRGYKVLRQLRIPIEFDGMQLDEGFRVDLLIDDCVLIEVKAVEQVHAVHRQQVKTYIKLMDLQLGFLINFNVSLIKDGIERIILSK
jgi:GxxExxY protein